MGAAREDLRVLPALLHRNVAPCQFGIRLFHSIVLSLSLSLFLALCLLIVLNLSVGRTARTNLNATELLRSETMATLSWTCFGILRCPITWGHCLAFISNVT